MSRDEELAQIAANDTQNYSIRKQALDDIKDKHLLNYLAKNAKDDWIRLESAIQTKNSGILKELTKHTDERIRLEAAIELNDQEVLAGIVINSGEDLHRDIALNYITSKDQLRTIVEKSTREQEKAEAAVRLGDKEVCKSLVAEIKNEDILLRMAKFINDYTLFAEISGKTTNSRIKKIAGEGLEELKPGSVSEID